MKKILLIIFLIGNTSIGFAQLKLGDTLPDIVLKNQKDVEVKINQSNGKFTLIDFWASWCAPCRVGNRKLVKLQDTYGSNKINIIGISVDTDKTKWINAIEKDKINFMQVIDPNGFKAKTALLFGVNALPAKYMFNPAGVLIAINPTDEQIINFLKK